MASLEKVKELFEAMQTIYQLKEVIESRIAPEESVSVREGDKDGVMLAEVKRRLAGMYIDELLGLFQGYRQDLLSDDQMDELIAIYRSELFRKFNAMVPDFLAIMQKTLGDITVFAEKRAIKIAKEVARDFWNGRLTISVQ